MKEKTERLKEKFNIFLKSNARYRIKRILEYGIFWSLFPAAFVTLFTYIIDYEVVWIGHADYLLLAFGIAVNTYGTEDDDEKHINYKHRKKYRKISFMSILACMIFYYGLFNEAVPLLNNVVTSIDNRGLNILQYITTGIIVINIICNIFMEVDDAMYNYSEKINAEKGDVCNEKA